MHYHWRWPSVDREKQNEDLASIVTNNILFNHFFEERIDDEGEEWIIDEHQECRTKLTWEDEEEEVLFTRHYSEPGDNIKTNYQASARSYTQAEEGSGLSDEVPNDCQPFERLRVQVQYERNGITWNTEAARPITSRSQSTISLT